MFNLALKLGTYPTLILSKHLHRGSQTLITTRVLVRPAGWLLVHCSPSPRGADQYTDHIGSVVVGTLLTKCQYTAHQVARVLISSTLVKYTVWLLVLCPPSVSTRITKFTGFLSVVHWSNMQCCCQYTAHQVLVHCSPSSQGSYQQYTGQICSVVVSTLLTKFTGCLSVHWSNLQCGYQYTDHRGYSAFVSTLTTKPAGWL